MIRNRLQDPLENDPSLNNRMDRNSVMPRLFLYPAQLFTSRLVGSRVVRNALRKSIAYGVDDMDNDQHGLMPQRDSLGVAKRRACGVGKVRSYDDGVELEARG